MDAPRVGIIANTEKPGARDVVRQLRGQFADLKVETVLEDKTAKFCRLKKGLRLNSLAQNVDILVLLGGDGTLLQLAKELGPKVKPIAAINIGTLGFLTMGTLDDLADITRLIATRTYELSERSVIAVRSVKRGREPEVRYALNEVSISRGTVTRAVKVEARVDGEFVTSYNGDGLMVATPTGSTAYSLSAGGPIIEPNSGVFVLTPVCSHSLSSRSLVVSDESEIEITAPDPEDKVIMTVDGQKAHVIDGDTKLELCRAHYRVPLVVTPDSSFFGVLRQKLDWSGSS